MLSMLCLVVVFGVHSLVDWTWYVPGDAFVALLCAGWLAGRGPLDAFNRDEAPTREWSPATSGNPAGRDPLTGAASTSASTTPAGTPAPGEAPIAASARRPRSPREIGPMRVGVAAAVIVAALLAAWSQWQPQRSVDASQEALALAEHQPSRRSGQGADGRRARSALGTGADRARGRTAELRAARAGARRRCSAPCACSLPTRRRGSRWPEHDLASEPARRVEGAAGGDLPEPRVDRTGSDRSTVRQPGIDRNLQRLRTGAARIRERARRRHYQRERTARASNSRRAPGGPAAERTETSWKPNSARATG